VAQKWVATDFGGLDVLRLVEVPVAVPGPGEVTITVRAAGMNPADYKRFAPGPAADRGQLPLPLGFEVAGTLTAVGPGTEIASGGGRVGDDVLAFRISGGYASEITVPARDVFAKPAALTLPAAANLLLAGATAADLLRAAAVRAGDVVLVHGGSGAVGVSVLQQARLLGARVVATCSAENSSLVAGFGAEPVRYGPGLADRVRVAAPAGVDAALDTVGTDEAVDVSLELVPDRSRIVTIAARARAAAAGFTALGGVSPPSREFRDAVRGRLIDLAGAGQLVVPVARTFPLGQAVDALALLQTGHPGGKLALIPD
jgi:NADPH:quinone reductase-like Zn-dependent oxidoreductase